MLLLYNSCSRTVSQALLSWFCVQYMVRRWHSCMSKSRNDSSWAFNWSNNWRKLINISISCLRNRHWEFINFIGIRLNKCSVISHNSISVFSCITSNDTRLCITAEDFVFCYLSFYTVRSREQSEFFWIRVVRLHERCSRWRKLWYSFSFWKLRNVSRNFSSLSLTRLKLSKGIIVFV